MVWTLPLEATRGSGTSQVVESSSILKSSLIQPHRVKMLLPGEMPSFIHPGIYLHSRHQLCLEERAVVVPGSAR